MSEYHMFIVELWRCLTTSRVSTSLCRVIFESPKANDALSLMTILSADLKALKQWGYNSEFATTSFRPQMADLFVIHQ